MLYSMTGFGEATQASDRLTVAVELRAVNNRYLKVTLRATEPYNLLEPDLEKVIRRTVKRGTLQVHLRVQRPVKAQDYVINAVALRSYLQQVRAASDGLALPDGGQSLLAQILALPGVVPEPASGAYSAEEDWPVFEKAVELAVGRMQQMRLDEGRAMASQLLHLRDHIGSELALVRKRVPAVADAYRERLFDRVKLMLSELDVRIDRNDLIREVAVFAERSDISEEVVRLASHLTQFQEVLEEPESAGRKLEFLTQEMFRETNTIGSKASDVEISRHVVEIKGTLEKIRELVQNVE
ncbi:MAG: YicC/YloC family endoribonuclease [Gemmataceae bacterium]